jgi:hypothetical protein
MENNISMIDWLSDWFKLECNGDWEHENGISISTVDNPGWSITIDLRDTSLENEEIVSDLVEINENDWFFFEVKNKKFRGGGDLSKLNFLISKFKEIVEKTY